MYMCKRADFCVLHAGGRGSSFRQRCVSCRRRIATLKQAPAKILVKLMPQPASLLQRAPTPRGLRRGEVQLCFAKLANQGEHHDESAALSPANPMVCPFFRDEHSFRPFINNLELLLSSVGGPSGCGRRAGRLSTKRHRLTPGENAASIGSQGLGPPAMCGGMAAGEWRFRVSSLTAS
jgi:hypothetical protein